MGLVVLLTCPAAAFAGVFALPWDFLICFVRRAALGSLPCLGTFLLFCAACRFGVFALPWDFFICAALPRRAAVFPALGAAGAGFGLGGASGLWGVAPVHGRGGRRQAAARRAHGSVFC